MMFINILFFIPAQRVIFSIAYPSGKPTIKRPVVTKKLYNIKFNARFGTVYGVPPSLKFSGKMIDNITEQTDAHIRVE